MKKILIALPALAWLFVLLVLSANFYQVVIIDKVFQHTSMLNAVITVLVFVLCASLCAYALYSLAKEAIRNRLCKEEPAH